MTLITAASKSGIDILSADLNLSQLALQFFWVLVLFQGSQFFVGQGNSSLARSLELGSYSRDYGPGGRGDVHYFAMTWKWLVTVCHHGSNL